MKKFQIFTDTTSDVEKKFRDEYELDYLKMVFTIEGKTYDGDLDWKEMTPEDYYNKMRKGNRAITGLVKNDDAEAKIKAALDAGLDVLYIACSSKLSGSVNSVKIIADELLQSYPDRKVVSYDSLRSNYAEGMMAMDAAKWALEGMDIDECVKKLDETKLNYQVYATVATLDWLKKAGRVKASTAFFGNLLGVKPIIVSDALGNNYGFKKVKGRKNSLDELVNIACERVINPEESTIYIEHADCLNDALYIKEQIEAKIKIKEINVSKLGPMIGATTGPDTITINFFGQKVEIASGE